jgi:hypothetical protein
MISFNALRNQLHRSTEVEAAKLYGNFSLSCCGGCSWEFRVVKTKLKYKFTQNVKYFGNSLPQFSGKDHWTR